MTRSGPIRHTHEQGTCAMFQAITCSSASNLDTVTSDMHQTGRWQAYLVHARCVFACSYIYPRMMDTNTYGCWLGWTRMGQASYQYPSARRHGTVPAFHTSKLTTRTPLAAAEPDRSRRAWLTMPIRLTGCYYYYDGP